MLSSIKLPLTTTSLPVALGIPDSDNHNSSYSRLKKLHTIYDYRNIHMIALRGSKMATTYRNIGCRVKHPRTGIDDQSDQTFFKLQGPTPRLTTSLVHFQSFVLLKFEEPAFGA